MNLSDEIRARAGAAADAVSGHFNARVRPRLAELLAEATERIPGGLVEALRSGVSCQDGKLDADRPDGVVLLGQMRADRLVAGLAQVAE